MQGIAFSCLGVHRTSLGGKKGLETEGKLVLMLGKEKSGFSGKRWVPGIAAGAKHPSKLDTKLMPSAGIWCYQSKHFAGLFPPPLCPLWKSFTKQGQIHSTTPPLVVGFPPSLSSYLAPIPASIIPQISSSGTQADHGWSLPCLLLIGALISPLWWWDWFLQALWECLTARALHSSLDTKSANCSN